MPTPITLLTKVGVVVVAGLLIMISIMGATGTPLSTLNPGFEGAKCDFYGLYFPSGTWQGYSGTDTLHRYQDAESVLVQQKAGDGFINTVSWTSLATPNDAGTGYESRKKYTYGPDEVSCKPDMNIHVESNIQLQDITRQGDPLNWNVTDPLDARRIEYWSKTAEKLSEVPDPANNQTVITYSYKVTKETFVLVPAEFWAGFYMIPAQQNAGTGSGWREGEWQHILVWFRLDFNTWDNAYKDAWLNDPNVNVFNSEYGGQILNQQKTGDYRGGFPIAGWIGAWEKAGWTSHSGKEVTSPTWLEARGKDTSTYTAGELAQIKEQLMAKVQFAPSLQGDFLSLYNEPSASFDYEAPLASPRGIADNPEQFTGYVKAPDSRMKKTMYFPINVLNFGTLVTGDFWNGWTVYYPSCYFRIRIIYGIYGTFTYLWTEQVTKPMDQGGLNYPPNFERHDTTVINQPGANVWTSGGYDWVAQWWWLLLIIGVGILGLVILAPWLGIFGLTILTSIFRRHDQKGRWQLESWKFSREYG